MPNEKIEPGDILIPATKIRTGQTVVIRAFGRYRTAKVTQKGVNFICADFKVNKNSNIVNVRRHNHNVYVRRHKMPIGDAVRLKGVRVHETVTNLAYDKTRKGPHRIVKLQAV